MTGPDRRLEILRRFTDGGATGSDGAARLCEVCRDAAAVTGAGIMLMSEMATRGTICTSNEVAATVERLQFELGEGPCIDAFATDAPVAEPDLARPVTARWVAFTPPAVEAGALAVFGFPLRVGAARIGALNLYRDRTGPLTDVQHSDVLIAADVAAHAVLLMQAGAPPGRLAEELEAAGDFHYLVHQAAGMVTAQLDTNIVDALVRLRAYAFAARRDVADVARDIVDRKLRLDWRDL